MSKKYDFTVVDDKIGQVEVIKKACEHFNVSFSGAVTDALIESFESGKFARLLKDDEAKDT